MLRGAADGTPLPINQVVALLLLPRALRARLHQLQRPQREPRLRLARSWVWTGTENEHELGRTRACESRSVGVAWA